MTEAIIIRAFIPLPPLIRSVTKPRRLQFRNATVTIAAPRAVNPYRRALGFERIAENSIYVDATVRRRGVATQLVSRVLDEARKRGYRIMMATVISTNTPSLRLHESLGYERMSTLVRGGQRGGKPIDLVLMKRVLQ